MIPASKSSKNNAGGIAGGTVGGILFLALVVGLFTLIVRRRRKRRAPEPSSRDDHKEAYDTSAISDRLPPYEMNQDSGMPAELAERHLFEAHEGQVLELDGESHPS